MSITIVDEPGIKSGVYYHEDKLAELEATIPRWISVEEHDYPVTMGMYLVWTEYGDELQNDYFDGKEFQIELYGAKVTHYMEQPAPPVEKNDA